MPGSYVRTAPYYRRLPPTDELPDIFAGRPNVHALAKEHGVSPRAVINALERRGIDARARAKLRAEFKARQLEFEL